jgi:hypothetical protein
MIAINLRGPEPTGPVMEFLLGAGPVDPELLNAMT